jgi:hypothetical protein
VALFTPCTSIGKLTIRKVHEDWKARCGEACQLKDFHDELLGPIEGLSGADTDG